VPFSRGLVMIEAFGLDLVPTPGTAGRVNRRCAPV
jgi:hypothetical protein